MNALWRDPTAHQGALAHFWASSGALTSLQMLLGNKRVRSAALIESTVEGLGLMSQVTGRRNVLQLRHIEKAVRIVGPPQGRVPSTGGLGGALFLLASGLSNQMMRQIAGSAGGVACLSYRLNAMLQNEAISSTAAPPEFIDLAACALSSIAVCQEAFYGTGHGFQAPVAILASRLEVSSTIRAGVPEEPLALRLPAFRMLSAEIRKGHRYLAATDVELRKVGAPGVLILQMALPGTPPNDVSLARHALSAFAVRSEQNATELFHAGGVPVLAAALPTETNPVFLLSAVSALEFIAGFHDLAGEVRDGLVLAKQQPWWQEALRQHQKLEKRQDPRLDGMNKNTVNAIKLLTLFVTVHLRTKPHCTFFTLLCLVSRQPSLEIYILSELAVMMSKGSRAEPRVGIF